MKGILSDVTPVTRRIVLDLRKGNASGPTRAREIIRAIPKAEKAGFIVTRDLEEVLRLAEAIGDRRRVRRNRNEGQVTEFYGFRPRQPQSRENSAVHQARAAFASELQRPIRMRLADLRRSAVLAAAKSVMKHGAAGGSSFEVRSGDQPDYFVEVEKDWSRVNKGRDHWASNIDRHVIMVSRSWLAVRHQIGAGDGTVAGHMLLDATPFLVSGERAVWEARLARTGRGFAAVVEDRWLSCYGRTVTIHRTLQKALVASPPVEYARPPSEEDEAALAALAL